MQKKHKYILLDIDGTLYSNAKYLRACKEASKNIRKYAAIKKLPEKTVDTLIREHAEKGRVTYVVKELSRRYKLDRLAFLDYVYAVDPKRIGVRKDSRLISLIKRSAAKYTLAVFTNSPNIWALRALAELGVKRYIKRNRVITLETLDNGALIKPSKEAFERVFKVLHAKPQEIVFLDDTIANVREAMKLGIDTIHICNDRECDIEGHRGATSIYRALRMLSDK